MPKNRYTFFIFTILTLLGIKDITCETTGYETSTSYQTSNTKMTNEATPSTPANSLVVSSTEKTAQTAAAATNATTLSLTLNTNNSKITPCVYAPGIGYGNRTEILKCCKKTVSEYKLLWSTGKKFLTRYFETLHGWKCPEFEEECRNRTYYNFHPYAALVYQYFCNKTTFENSCIDTISSTLKRNTGNLNLSKYSNSSRTWPQLVKQLNNLSLSLADSLQPCVQVATYEAVYENFGDFQEIVSVDVPSCGIVWCGFREDLTRHGISPWSCMAQGCRSGIVTIIVICVVLAILISLGNILILVVIGMTPALHHSQSVYKFSIAVSDLIVGIVIFPSSVNSLLNLAMTPYLLANVETVSGYLLTDGSPTTAQVRGIRSQFGVKFSTSYLSFLGFFTTVSITVSVYTLTVAGIDRLIAVYKPLRYRKDKAKKLAKWLCLVLWVLTVICGILPIFIPSLRYSLIASFLVTSGGSSALILYIVAFALPVLAMWVISIVTYQLTRKHAQASSHLTVASKNKTRSVEARLARTLSIMVGAFTLSLIPAAAVTIATFLTSSIYYSLPERLDVTGASVFIAVEFFCFIILACNSLWNFFIYNARNAEFKSALKKLCVNFSRRSGLAECWNSTWSCAQQMAHDGRRRISSIPNITLSTVTARKKSSSGDITSVSKLSNTDNKKGSEVTGGSSSAATTSVFRSTVGSSSDGLDKSKSSKTSLPAETSITENSYQPKYDKKKNRGKNTQPYLKSEEQAPNDSIFQSFAVDCNADRLFVSVMENVDDEIMELKYENKQNDKV